MPPFSFKKQCQWCIQHEAAKRGEESDDAIQQVIPAPWVQRSANPIQITQIIVGLNVLVFLAMGVTGTSIFNPPIQNLLQWGANWGPLTIAAPWHLGSITIAGQWWRLLAYMFLHGGIIHIGFNMWCLWDLGALAESLYGSWTFTGIYLLTGVGAGLSSVAWHPNEPSVGASGAIFGIAGALVASFYLGEFSLPRVAIQGVQRSVALFVIYNLVFGAFSGLTDNAAHVGGLVFGLILGALVAKLAPDHNDVFRRAAVLLFVAFCIFAGAIWLRAHLLG